MRKTITLSLALIFTFAAISLAQHKHGEHEKHKLGRKQIGDYLVSVIVIGETDHDTQIDFDIKLIDAKTDPKALRVWIGTEDAAGSKKAEGTKGKTTFTGKIEVPKPMPAGAKLWVEIETDSGVKSGWFDHDKHDHKH